ncbi:hypothetical protein GCM10010990_35930 [Croceicoccus mobilis]|uniref:FAD-binding domain-containing protein n=1 Tax=Croceicoccus mobilis TaxID=1703339 RepID=A0A917DZV5_9SPHN|nr:hypothetical protein GCM10010990_35930 [Croceicoccus mobilis]
MYIHHGLLLHAPSDLVRFLGCGHATALHLLQATDPAAAPDKAADGDLNVLTQKAGLRHEETYRQFLEVKGGLVEIATAGTEHRADCRFIAGCDGFHCPSHKAVRMSVGKAFGRVYTFGWLGSLADVPLTGKIEDWSDDRT